MTVSPSRIGCPAPVQYKEGGGVGGEAILKGKRGEKRKKKKGGGEGRSAEFISQVGDVRTPPQQDRFGSGQCTEMHPEKKEEGEGEEKKWCLSKRRGEMKGGGGKKRTSNSTKLLKLLVSISI